MVVFLIWAAGIFQLAEALVFKNKTHDFGAIQEAEGVVQHTFSFTNQAGRAIRIVSVQASCGCTTPAWSDQPVGPGKTGFVKATFDPAGRPGYFQKTITVTTDLPGPPVVLTLTGQVVSGPAAATAFSVARGALRFRMQSFNLGTVHNNRPAATKEFEVINAGAEPVGFLSVEAPAHVRVSTPQRLQPGERGTLKVVYDGQMKGGYGFVSGQIVLVTDQPTEPNITVPVFATLEEFFPEPSAAERARAPQLVIEPADADMGTLRPGQTRELVIQLKNTGKSNLVIREWQPNCACLEGQLPSLVIKPQAVVPFTVRWTGEGRSGTHLKAITIYSNDPVNPVQRLALTAVLQD